MIDDVPVSRIRLLYKIALIAIPVSLQMLLFSSKSMIDVMMIGQLGQEEVAAMGIAGRIVYVAILVFIGVNTGAGVLLSQYYGARSWLSLKRVQLLCMLLNLLIGAVFLLLFVDSSMLMMELSTSFTGVQKLGSEYLVMFSLSMIPMGITLSLSTGLRSIHKANIPMVFSLIGLIINIFLNYILIFGHFGFEERGIQGAAIATSVSCLIELILLFSYLIKGNSVLIPKRQELACCFSKDEFNNILRLALPVTINMLIYSLGLYVYSVVFGYVDLGALTAFTVMIPIESIATSFLIGFATGSSVILGNEIGAGNDDNALGLARLTIAMSFIVGCLICVVLALLKTNILNLFPTLSHDVREISSEFYNILLIGLVIRSLPICMIIGVLRSGGDNKFCLYQDVFAQWGVGIPFIIGIAYYFPTAFVVIYMAFFVEELVKIFLCTSRIRSGRWVKSQMVSA
ncbi:MATE family efflux transporter [Vibrio nomapromontoriensis]|uniref:MATE family efflux transporter n=1 Tax=Vibrio nomapromontoriensis TaxID=2910246 RepID=UPI003D133ADE